MRHMPRVLIVEDEAAIAELMAKVHSAKLMLSCLMSSCLIGCCQGSTAWYGLENGEVILAPNLFLF